MGNETYPYLMNTDPHRVSVLRHDAARIREVQQQRLVESLPKRKPLSTIKKGK